jgi:hypothetical protein
LIECRLPGSSDAADCDASPDGGKLHGVDRANGNWNTHVVIISMIMARWEQLANAAGLVIRMAEE